MDIADWLRSLGLEQYELAFRDHAIDAAVLPRMTRDDLKDIGVAKVGHRRKLLEAIAVLWEPTPTPDPSAVISIHQKHLNGERSNLSGEVVPNTTQIRAWVVTVVGPRRRPEMADVSADVVPIVAWLILKDGASPILIEESSRFISKYAFTISSTVLIEMPDGSIIHRGVSAWGSIEEAKATLLDEALKGWEQEWGDSDGRCTTEP